MHLHHLSLHSLPHLYEPVTLHLSFLSNIIYNALSVFVFVFNFVINIFIGGRPRPENSASHPGGCRITTRQHPSIDRPLPPPSSPPWLWLNSAPPCPRRLLLPRQQPPPSPPELVPLVRGAPRRQDLERRRVDSQPAGISRGPRRRPGGAPSRHGGVFVGRSPEAGELPVFPRLSRSQARL